MQQSYQTGCTSQYRPDAELSSASSVCSSVSSLDNIHMASSLQAPLYKQRCPFAATLPGPPGRLVGAPSLQSSGSTLSGLCCALQDAGISVQQQQHQQHEAATYKAGSWKSALSRNGQQLAGLQGPRMAEAAGGDPFKAELAAIRAQQSARSEQLAAAAAAAASAAAAAAAAQDAGVSPAGQAGGAWPLLGISSSRNSSSTEQPPTPLLAQSSLEPPQLQQSASLPGFPAAAPRSSSGNHSNSSSIVLPPSSSALGTPRSSQQLRQLLALGAMAQLQEVTEGSQQLQHSFQAVQGSATDVKELIEAALRQFQREQDALRDKKRELEMDLFGKKQQLESMIRQLREQNNTPADKRASSLQQELDVLKQQLRERDAALAAAEDECRLLQAQLGMTGQEGYAATAGRRHRQHQCGRGREQQADDGVSRRLWPGDGGGAGGDDGDDTTAEADGTVGSSLLSSRSSDFSSSRSGSGSSELSAVAVARAEHESQLAAVEAQHQQQLQRSAEEMDQVCAGYEERLAAEQQQAQELRTRLEQLQQELDRRPVVAVQQAAPAPPAAASASSPPAIRPISQQLSEPQSIEEAVAQIAGLRASLALLQQQLRDQDDQATARAAEREGAFTRQLAVEKRQHDGTRAKCKLLEAQLEQLNDRLEAADSRELQLQDKLERLQQQLEQAEAAAAAAAALAGSAGGSSAGGSAATPQQHIQRLQRHIREQKAEIQQVQECLHSLYAQVRAAGRLATRTTTAGGTGDNLLTQLELSIQVLLADVQQQEQPQQQQGQQQQQQLQQENQQLRWDNARLADRIAQYDAEAIGQAEQLAGAEQQLLQLQSCMQQCEQLQQACQQKQQLLEEARSQLEAALRGQRASALHTEQLRQQLAGSQAENEMLRERMRELADRASPGPSSSSSSGASPAAAAVAQVQQQLAGVTAELMQSQQKEERLHVLNAQLQERISSLQVERANGWTAEAQQQAVRQEAAVAAAAAQLQQETQQQAQRIAALQQQLEHQQEQSALQAEAEAELRLNLAERTREVEEWQVHADALETDLADLKERLAAADALTDAAEQQQELQQSREAVAALTRDLEAAGRDRAVLQARLDAATAELAAARREVGELRQRLEASGPAGRVRQLEAALQSAQRKAEVAEGRAAKAAAEAAESASRLSAAEDEIIACEGQISILEAELAKFTGGRSAA